MDEVKGKVDGEATEVREPDATELENERLKSELKNKNAAIAAFEQSITEKDAGISALKQSLEKSIQDSAVITRQLEQAVTTHKELVVHANPGLVAEMIKGNTIEEVDESVKSAQALVERVKRELGAENARVRVPAGAPQRTPLDLSVLSPREKIKYAMEGG
jgi:multidrug resistance efflux pump